MDLARETGCRLDLVPAPGSSSRPAHRCSTCAQPAALHDDDVTNLVVLSLERTSSRTSRTACGCSSTLPSDPVGLSLSGPDHAVQAIDRLHDCLRQLARRPFPDGKLSDADGIVRLAVPSMDWDAYVHLAFDEIRLAGAGSPQVSRRLRSALHDYDVAPPDRQLVLRLSSISSAPLPSKTSRTGSPPPSQPIVTFGHRRPGRHPDGVTVSAAPSPPSAFARACLYLGCGVCAPRFAVDVVPTGVSSARWGVPFAPHTVGLGSLRIPGCQCCPRHDPGRRLPSDSFSSLRTVSRARPPRDRPSTSPVSSQSSRPE